MARSPVLLQQLLPNIRNDLTSAFHAARTAHGVTTKDMAEQLCEEVSELFESALADIRRSHNCLHSRAVAVSPEIWCNIWSFLAPHELARVTHVCSHWRDIALGSSRLWSHVVFDNTAQHELTGSDVHECGRLSLACGHGLSRMIEWLSRSRAAALSVDLRVHHRCASIWLSHVISAALKPHSERLRSLTCRFSSPTFFSDVLAGIRVFPALTSLRFLSLRDYAGTVGVKWGMGHLRYRELSLPVLREFVGRDLYWRQDDEMLMLSRLEVLECFVDAPPALLRILARSPRLQTLAAVLGWNDEDAAVLPAADFDSDSLAPHMRTTIFANATPAYEPLLAPILRRPSVRYASVSYAALGGHETPALFAPLGDDLRLSVADMSSRLKVEVSDARGTTRALALPRAVVLEPIDALPLALGGVRLATLQSLTLAWELRGALLHATLAAPQLKSIRLLVREQRLGEDIQGFTRPFFPSLAVAVLESAEHGEHCVLPRRLVDEYLSALSKNP
ncbi:hypothetical protein AURDEDRAFT_154918, partial [Auricularia subglabra TFB-10046 SS5]